MSASPPRQHGIPAGFRVLASNPELRLEHRSVGAGCFIVFLLIALLGMAVGLGMILARHPDAIAVWRGGLFAVVCALCGVVGWFWWLAILLWMMFGVTEIRAVPDELIVRKRLLGLTWQRVIPREKLRKFQQIQDGGGEGDSFPSWGLKAQTTSWRSATLLFRQPHETSLWLGGLLSTYYGIELVTVPEESH